MGVSIETGILFVVATPLGNLADLGHRAAAVLQAVDLIAAEDTRHSTGLLKHYRIDTPCISLHEHNEQARVPGLLARLEQGESIALISDAGTPLVSDPGYRLVRAARAAGVRVSPIPGPSAPIAALSAAGLPTDRFVFEGFLPARSSARRKRLRELGMETRTLIFLEASHRIVSSLANLRDVLGPERKAAIARELTKTFETIHGDRLDRLCDWLMADADQRRGEFVIIVEGAAPPEESTAGDNEARRVLSLLLDELPLKTAARLAAEITGRKKNELYRLALKLGNKQ